MIRTYRFCLVYDHDDELVIEVDLFSDGRTSKKFLDAHVRPHDVLHLDEVYVDGTLFVEIVSVLTS